jgi:hypothetical protein
MMIATFREDDARFKVETNRSSGYQCDLQFIQDILPYKLFLEGNLFRLTNLYSNYCILRLTYFHFAREVTEPGHALFHTQAHFWHVLQFWYIFGTAKASPKSATGDRFFSASGCEIGIL